MSCICYIIHIHIRIRIYAYASMLRICQYAYDTTEHILEIFSRFSTWKWLKLRPKFGLDCPVCSKFIFRHVYAYSPPPKRMGRAGLARIGAVRRGRVRICYIICIFAYTYIHVVHVHVCDIPSRERICYIMYIVAYTYIVTNAYTWYFITYTHVPSLLTRMGSADVARRRVFWRGPDGHVYVYAISCTCSHIHICYADAYTWYANMYMHAYTWYTWYANMYIYVICKHVWFAYNLHIRDETSVEGRCGTTQGRLERTTWSRVRICYIICSCIISSPCMHIYRICICSIMYIYVYHIRIPTYISYAYVVSYTYSHVRICYAYSYM